MDPELKYSWVEASCLKLSYIPDNGTILTRRFMSPLPHLSRNPWVSKWAGRVFFFFWASLSPTGYVISQRGWESCYPCVVFPMRTPIRHSWLLLATSFQRWKWLGRDLLLEAKLALRMVVANAGENKKLDILFAFSENTLGNKERKSPLISSVQLYKKIWSWGIWGVSISVCSSLVSLLWQYSQKEWLTFSWKIQTLMIRLWCVIEVHKLECA